MKIASYPVQNTRPEITSKEAGSTVLSTSEQKKLAPSSKETLTEAIIDENTKIDEDLLQKSVDQANKNLQQFHRVIERSVHEVTHTIMYKLVDSETNEVISEFPPKKIQDMIAKMWELAGLFVDEKA